MVKRLPTMQETWVRSLSGEDPLEKEMATLVSTLLQGKGPLVFCFSFCFFFFLIEVYIVDLQYCVTFSCITK